MNGNVYILLKGQGIKRGHVLSIPMNNSPCGFVLKSWVGTWVAVCSDTTVSVIFGLYEDSKIFIGDRIVKDIATDFKLKTGKTVPILRGVNIEAQRGHVVNFNNFFPIRLDDIHDFEDIGSYSCGIGDVCGIVDIMDSNGPESCWLEITGEVTVINWGKFNVMFMDELVMDAVVMA